MTRLFRFMRRLFRPRRDYVSPSWVRKHEREQQSRGIDQSYLAQWPINKAMNEAAHFNTWSLRADADLRKQA